MQNPRARGCKVDECEKVIAIVAHRYGWIPDDQPGGGTKSFTWLECERAKECGSEKTRGRRGRPAPQQKKIWTTV